MKLYRGFAAVSAVVGSVALSTGAIRAGEWDGGYVGASLGYGRVNDVTTSPVATGSFTVTGKGGLGGIQGGYNWQNGSIVAGLEADILTTGVKGTLSNCAGVANATCGEKLSSLGSFRGRLGFAAAPSAMIYFTGGLGFGSGQWTVSSPTTAYSYSKTETAFVFGAGAEFLVAKNWSVKGEYLRYNFGQVSDSFASLNYKDSLDTFKVGVNYKF